jgi:hypothetical protein
LKTTTSICFFAALERLHAAPAAGPVPSHEALASDHLAQLHECLDAYKDFSALPDAQRVADVEARRVEAYAADAAALRFVSLVHGNRLLSNALLESSNVLRLLSARGSLVQGRGAGALPALASASATATAAAAAAAALPSERPPALLSRSAAIRSWTLLVCASRSSALTRS